MNPIEFLQKSERTDPNVNQYLMAWHRLNRRAGDESMMHVLHYALGAGTEAGEIQDAIKKHIFYGADLDVVNLKEEVGDLLWYLAGFCRVFGWTFEEVMKLNIDKLEKRFPEKFTEEAAQKRDLEAERKLLEE